MPRSRLTHDDVARYGGLEHLRYFVCSHKSTASSAGHSRRNFQNPPQEPRTIADPAIIVEATTRHFVVAGKEPMAHRGILEDL